MTSTEAHLDTAQIKAISEKAEELSRWLSQNAPDCQRSQKHLEDETMEQAYWHYRYLCALRDILPILFSATR